MEYELSWLTISLLITAGIAAGFINTLAGGGAMFTVPALMLLGMPADMANGTNRLAVVVQSLTAVRSFRKHGKLDSPALIRLLIPTLAGSLIGAVAISYLPVNHVKNILLGTMLTLAIIMAFCPDLMEVPQGTRPYSLKEKPIGNFWMFLTGLYGGAIQGGVGFVLLAVLVGVLRYDLLKGNAMKMACVSAFGALSLVVFIVRGQVLWIPGTILAAATIIGVQFSIRFALKVNQKILKQILLGMVILTCILAFLDS